uniref:V-type proton ATPase subunit C n=1 Tax=Timema douglasi TaxID=61478 RepID=A0A7R8Z7S1_TIMDO|nr:unnamed protein product [Timema douglasi]
MQTKIAVRAKGQSKRDLTFCNFECPYWQYGAAGPLVRWLKVNFSESFCAWVHVKALRVFVESVLRYGLPVNFQAMLLHPSKKNTKRLRDVLNQLYGHLDSSALQSSGAQHDSVDIPGLGFGQSEYYAYVYYKINIDMVDTKV